MRTLLINLTILLILSPTLATAAVLSAEGYGETDSQARGNALAALAESMYVDIRSDYFSRQDNQGNNRAEMTVVSSSHIPLLGVDVRISKDERGYHALASLDPGSSLPLYRASLKEMVSSVNRRSSQMVKLEPAARMEALQEVLSMLDQLQRMRSVARLLGDDSDYSVMVSRDQIVQHIQQITARASSINIAATKLAQLDRYAAVYVYPPHPQGSREITQLSRLLRDAVIAKAGQVVSEPAQASHFYRGEYEVLSSGIYISYRLLDATGSIVRTNTAILAPEAYSDIAYQPKHANFDQLLHAGYVQDRNLRASLATNRGSEDLLFQQGETLKLYVKLSRPGYFYIVGHASNDKGDHSYLLELGEGMDKRKFVSHVNADDVNKWMELGEFEVAPPFGIESLQLIAANKDLIGKVPDASWDDRLQLFVVSRDTAGTVNKTRALKLKKSSEDESAVAESVLMLTTLP